MRFGCWLSSVTISPASAGVMSGGRRVEPDDDGKVAVVRQQFFHLRDRLGVKVGVEVAVLRLIPVMRGQIVMAGLIGAASRRGPVLILRIVEAELHALLLAFLGELADRVAMKRCGRDDVEGIGFGIEHGEAIVVLRGDDDVLHPGRLWPARRCRAH